MFIDTHIHESKYSGDSFVSLGEIVRRGKELGLGGVCITDHESNEIKEEARAISKKENYLIIVGAEFLTFEGDMTVFGLNKLPGAKIHAKEMIELLVKNEGIGISSHPYRQNNRGMGDYIRELRGLWGIEAFNGSTPYHHNMQAYELALELGIPALGASDAHHSKDVGKFATYVPDWVKSEEDFIQVVKAGSVFPAVYYDNGYKIIDSHITMGSHINMGSYSSVAKVV